MRRTSKVKYSDRPSTYIVARDGAWSDWQNARMAKIKAEVRTAAILNSNRRRSHCGRKASEGSDTRESRIP